MASSSISGNTSQTWRLVRSSLSPSAWTTRTVQKASSSVARKRTTWPQWLRVPLMQSGSLMSVLSRQDDQSLGVVDLVRARLTDADDPFDAPTNGGHGRAVGDIPVAGARRV